jgi:hypothetical protein
MPKEAARIWLEVTNVRVERLQDITNIDIMAEGVLNDLPVSKFAELWDACYIKRGLGWSANPWVWAIEFRKSF